MLILRRPYLHPLQAYHALRIDPPLLTETGIEEFIEFFGLCNSSQQASRGSLFILMKLSKLVSVNPLTTRSLQGGSQIMVRPSITKMQAPVNHSSLPFCASKYSKLVAR